MANTQKAARFPILVLVAALACASCAGKADSGEDDRVTAMGKYEITARLVEIRGELPDIPLYDYSFIFKYEIETVHRGELAPGIIYIGHYNPLKPRDGVADVRSGEIGGKLKRFRVGDIHRMALDVPIDDFFMGGIVNRYADEDTGPIYWAMWTNRVTK